MLFFKYATLLVTILISQYSYAEGKWVYLIDSKNGVKYEIDESSIARSGDNISFELRSQVTKSNASLMDLFTSGQAYDIAGYVANCNEPKFSTFFSKKIDADGKESGSTSVTTVEFASQNLKPAKADSIVNIAALKYCPGVLNPRNLKTLSDVSDKDLANINEWSLIRTNFKFPNTEIRANFLADLASVSRINDSIIQAPTLAILQQPSELDSVKDIKYILTLHQIDCKNSMYRAEIVEYYDLESRLMRRGGWRGYQPEFKPIPQNSNLDMVAVPYCAKIAQLPVFKKGGIAQVQQIIVPSTPLKVADGGNVASGKRIALVIGNASYKTRPLLNPINDAVDISTSLKGSGFEVIEVHDATLVQMRNAIRQFGDKLLTSDVGLVYYSGHGIEVKGQNYLIPVNADIKRSDEISDQSINMGLILGKMETAQKGVNILIVDACRDDPFGRSFRSSASGLAQVDAPRGTIVAFATSPGKVAADGEGRNSPYTKNLIKAMQVPNLPIEQVFKQVRRAVQEETKNQQTPWENTSLSGDFYFKK